MSRRNRAEKIETRDPIPTTRDPEPVERQHPVIIRLPVAKCSACGCSVFREGGNSKPNISTREMLRYRKCAHCGRAFYFAVPMNQRQIAENVEGDK